MFFQNPYNFGQGLRISTRGFGARVRPWASAVSTSASDGYATVNARLGRSWRWGDGRRIEAWIGLENITDADYVANVRANAERGRLFEAAPGRTVLAGIELGF